MISVAPAQIWEDSCQMKIKLNWIKFQVEDRQIHWKWVPSCFPEPRCFPELFFWIFVKNGFPGNHLTNSLWNISWNVLRLLFELEFMWFSSLTEAVDLCIISVSTNNHLLQVICTSITNGIYWVLNYIVRLSNLQTTTKLNYFIYKCKILSLQLAFKMIL